MNFITYYNYCNSECFVLHSVCTSRSISLKKMGALSQKKNNKLQRK